MHLFFSTPVWVNQIENHETINDELITFIYNEKNNDPEGTRKSNVRGWHSKNFDLQNKNLSNFIKSISSKIKEAVDDMAWDTENQIVKISSMWSIVNKKDSFNERHHHGNSDLSAAYYVSADEDSGNIVFYDTRNAFTFSHPKTNHVNDLNGQVKSITPKN